MAPGSERANEVCETCGQRQGHWYHAPMLEYSAGRHLFKAEPTLTCSEVVERLQSCLTIVGDEHGFRPVLNGAKAEAILHSWRERRVQELEEALRRISDKTEHTCPTSFRNGSVCCKCVAIGALKAEAERNSEWREQIRKGAK